MCRHSNVVLMTSLLGCKLIFELIQSEVILTSMTVQFDKSLATVEWRNGLQWSGEMMLYFQVKILSLTPRQSGLGEAN